MVVAWDEIRTSTSTVWSGIYSGLTQTWDSLKTVMGTDFESIKNTSVTTWESIKTSLSSTWDSILVNAGTTFDKIKNAILEAFAGVKTQIGGIWSDIWSTLKYYINKIIDGMNSMIRGMNKLKWEAPSWVPVIGGKSWGINLPTIPALATGTNFVPRDMLAYLHEGEAVVPKEFNPAAGSNAMLDIDGLISKIASAFGQAQPAMAGGGGDVYVYIGNEQLDAYIHRSQDRRNIRSNGR